MERAIQIKEYIERLFAPEDEILQAIRKNAREEGLPEIEVSPQLGKLLYLLTKMHKPERVLELGTLGGYSTVWFARALSETGKVVSLEYNPHHAHVARRNLASLGYEKKVEIREGAASHLMDTMIEKGEGPYDLIFIDADKINYPAYLTKAIALSRSGTLILSDDLIPKGGEVVGICGLDPLASREIYEFNRMLSAHPQLESILVTTIVGDKGRIDALGLSLVSKES